jgi:hypothetical protein
MDGHRCLGGHTESDCCGLGSNPKSVALVIWSERGTEADAGFKPGVTSAEAAELGRLRKQLREVTEDRDSLALAVGLCRVGGNHKPPLIVNQVLHTHHQSGYAQQGRRIHATVNHGQKEASWINYRWAPVLTPTQRGEQLNRFPPDHVIL